MHIIALFANVIGLAIAITWAASTRAYDAYLAVVGLSGTLPLTLKNSVAGYVASAIQSLGLPVTIVLLGKPNTGKTVFLTAQLHALMHTSTALTFVPRTRETIDRLIERYRSLTAGEWLPRTISGALDTPFSGTLLARRRFGKTASCDISFFDSSGETLHKAHRGETSAESTQGESFLSRYASYRIPDDESFSDALKCQHLFFFIGPDCNDIYDYVSAVHVLADSMTRNQDMKLPKTVSIIFSKSDLLTDAQRKEVVARASPLIAACDRTVFAHKTFFVSSTRELISGRPASPLQSENLLAPIEWCLAQKLP